MQRWIAPVFVGLLTVAATAALTFSQNNTAIDSAPAEPPTAPAVASTPTVAPESPAVAPASREQILAALAQEAPELLGRYIRIDTVNPPGNELAGARFIEEVLSSQPLIETRVLESAPGRGNLYARLRGTGSERPIVLLSHIDVVPADGAEWNHPPWVGIVHALTLLALAELDVRLSRDVIMLATADEETGGRLGAGWLVEHHRDLFANAEFVLNEGGFIRRAEGRPLVYNVNAGEKGPCWFRVIATGDPGHASRPAAETAVSRLVEALGALLAWERPLEVGPVVAGYYAAYAALDEEHARQFRQLDRALEDVEFREILAVTFTNKAARELVDRLGSLIGAAAADVWAGTFHGIGARMLRRHAEILRYPSAFSIYDADDQLRLIKELVAEANLDDTTFPPDAIRAYIEAAKHEAKLPGRGLGKRTDLFGHEAYGLFDRYQQRLRAHGAMDFGDLIVNVLELFHADEDLLRRYQRRFRHVFVDEYQDTNHAQYLMVSKLAAGHGNICVVGDDDQSIYGWRGADLRNILEFERDFGGAKIVHLEQNYRSTGNIIKAAQAVIANNRQRMTKAMWTDASDGPPVRLYAASDERDEARWIIDQLVDLGEDRNKAAVFYRTNAQSRAIEEELVRRRMPYVIVGATRF
jgi:hypothetical protein